MKLKTRLIRMQIWCSTFLTRRISLLVTLVVLFATSAACIFWPLVMWLDLLFQIEVAFSVCCNFFFFFFSTRRAWRRELRKNILIDKKNFSISAMFEIIAAQNQTIKRRMRQIEELERRLALYEPRKKRTDEN